MTSKLKKLAADYWPVVLVAVLLSGAFSLRHFVIPNLLPENETYASVVAGSDYGDEAIFYAPRANRVAGGDLLSGDVALLEHQKSPSLFPPAGSLILGGLTALFGSLNAAVAVSDFIFPFATFILLYLLFFELTQRKLFSILAASLFIAAPELGTLFPPVSVSDARELLQSFLPFLSRDTLQLTQFDEPKFTLPFTLLAMFLVARALKTGKRAYTLAAGAASGLLFYTYLYDFASIAVTLGLLCLFFAAQRDFKRLRIVGLISAAALIVSIPYWLNFIELQNLPYSADLVDRAGSEISRSARFAFVWKTYLLIAALGAALSLLIRKKRLPPETIVIIAALASYFATVNIQLVVGFNPHPDHWYKFMRLPIWIAIALVGSAIAEFILKRVIQNRNRLNRFLKPIGYIFLAFFASGLYFNQYEYAKENARTFALNKKVTASYEWLLENAPNKVVGAVSFETLGNIVLLTKSFSYTPLLSASASDREIWERYLGFLALNHVPALKLRAELAGNGAYLLFSEKYADRTFNAAFKVAKTGHKIPEKTVAEKVAEYEGLLTEPGLPRYQLDYIYIGPRERELGARLASDWKEVYNDGRAAIYEYSLGEDGN